MELPILRIKPSFPNISATIHLGSPLHQVLTQFTGIFLHRSHPISQNMLGLHLQMARSNVAMLFLDHFLPFRYDFEDWEFQKAMNFMVDKEALFRRNLLISILKLKDFFEVIV
ncbi:hypothetical protein LXL04_012069 [Taraxacum kok-saghyz]